MAHTLPLVGRSDEIAMLQRLLDDASEGRGSAIFVAGEGGVGKTRLVTTIAGTAAEQGWTIALGRAYPVEAGVPYALFSDAMTPLLRSLDQSALTLLTRGGADELAALFPGLAPADDRSRSGARGDPSEIKTRLLWNFAQFLGRYAAKKPLLLVLENLQWADSASLELLHFVARQLGSMRVAVVCTYNDLERDQSPSLRTIESSLVSLGAARVHPLGPLTRAGTDTLLREGFGADAGAAREFAALLYGWTRGNPFFLEEVLGALIDAGTLYQRDGAWHGWEVETLALPASIRDALRARVSRLSPEARALADIAAVIGTRASYDALRCVTTVERSELLAVLDELRGANVLIESESAAAVVYDFAHPMVRDALYGELGLARARQLHATVGESLERYYGQRALDHADELAFHFARANAADLTPKAIRYLVAAGRSALKKHANREGANYLSAALELADRSGTDADRDRAGGDPPLVDQLARARQRLGEYDAALALWVRALSDAVTADDQLRIAAIERRMGLASYWRGRHQEALTHYERGIAAAGRAGDVVLAARLLIATGVTYVELGRPADGEREMQRALTVAESRKDSPLMARAHRALLLLHLWTGSPERAREHGAHAIELSRESDQLTVEWSAHWALALLGGLTGNADETQRHLRESERLADQLHSPVLRLWSAEIEIEVASAQGDWSGALAIAERSVALARVLGQRALLPRLLVWSGILYLGRGEMERGRASIDQAWDLSGASRGASGHVDVHTVVPAHTGRATYHLAVGEYAEAMRVGRAGLAIADRSGYVVWGIYRLLPVIAEASLRINDLASARWVGERLRRDSERVGHPLGLAWADACDALVATLGGDAERGVGVLRDAASALEAIPFVPDAARLRRELGFRLAELGDREGALRELRSAHDVFAKLGAAPDLATAREQIRELGARPPTRASAPGAAGLTPREVEIVRLVAERKSNKEIGKALDISSRTVSTHLSNIFTKLEVTTRGELTDYVREHRL